MTQVLSYLYARWPSLIVTVLYAIPIFIYRFRVAEKYEYPKRIFPFTVLFVLLFLAFTGFLGKLCTIIWIIGHAVVLTLHYILWLRNIIKKLPIGYPEGGYITLVLAFLVQVLPLLVLWCSQTVVY